MSDRSIFSDEARAAKFDRWERIGAELIKADLKTGGHSFVGTDPHVRALAEEWLQKRDREKAHALKDETATAATAIGPAAQWFTRLWQLVRLR